MAPACEDEVLAPICSKYSWSLDIKESIIRLEYLMDLGKNLSDIGYTPVMFTKYLSDMIDDGNIEYSLNNDDSNSVKILNIHKSKGLEYNICYYTGLSKRINESDSKAKFLVGNNYNIIIPYINDGINETIEKDIFLFNENKESISEKIRLFYVALTRTREKMIVVTPYGRLNKMENTLNLFILKMKIIQSLVKMIMLF